MSEKIKDAIDEQIPPDSVSDEALTGDKVSSFNKTLAMMVQNDALRAKVEQSLAQVDAKLGLRALESPQDYSPDNKVECILHYMRWDPGYLFDCPVRELHEYEMIIASMIAYIQDKENKWIIQTKLANKKLNRIKKLASQHFEGKTVGEREAAAFQGIKELRNIESKIDVYSLYAQKCEGLVDVFSAIDNSLKKTLERRRFEELVQHNMTGKKLNAEQTI